MWKFFPLFLMKRGQIRQVQQARLKGENELWIFSNTAPLGREREKEEVQIGHRAGTRRTIPMILSSVLCFT